VSAIITFAVVALGLLFVRVYFYMQNMKIIERSGMMTYLLFCIHPFSRDWYY